MNNSLKNHTHSQQSTDNIIKYFTPVDLSISLNLWLTLPIYIYYIFPFHSIVGISVAAPLVHKHIIENNKCTLPRQVPVAKRTKRARKTDQQREGAELHRRQFEYNKHWHIVRGTDMRLDFRIQFLAIANASIFFLHFPFRFIAMMWVCVCVCAIKSSSSSTLFHI